ncbi:YadA C-terminal domain-containing protein, partial [Propionispora vibrioides]
AKSYADTQDQKTLTSANNYSDAQDKKTLDSAKNYADSQDQKTLTSANNYADAQDKKTLTSANNYADTQDQKTLTSANNYADTQDQKTLTSANSYSDVQDKKTLDSAKSYTDTQDSMLQNQITNNSNNISSLSQRVDDLSNRVDKVGALSAAMTALAPLDYDPQAPTQISVGAGTYGGSQAVAIGVYHYANKDTLYNAAWSISGSEQMGRVGATWRVGRPHHPKEVAVTTDKHTSEIQLTASPAPESKEAVAPATATQETQEKTVSTAEENTK